VCEQFVEVEHAAVGPLGSTGDEMPCSRSKNCSKASPVTGPDTDGDNKPDATLPGGFFVVDPGKAEPLVVVLSGTAGSVYEYSVDFKVVENGTQRVESLGSQQRPLRIAFDDYQSPQRSSVGFNSRASYYDRNFTQHAWTPAPKELAGR
jgi:hypothetical protein